MTSKAPWVALGYAVAAVATPVILSACAATHDATAPRPALDARTPIGLVPADREHLRAGMHGYLDSIQGAVDALNQRRMDRLAEAARKSGMGALRAVSLGTAASLPAEFTLLSLDTHEKFDGLAQLAAQNANRKQILDQMSGILANCQACHAMYRLAEK